MQRRSFTPPVETPPAPGETVKTIDQVQNWKADYSYGSLKKLEPKPQGGIPLQGSMATTDDRTGAKR